MKRSAGFCVVMLMAGCAGGGEAISDPVAAAVTESGADVVGIWFRDLNSDAAYALNPDVRMHAASTMKVPVMVRVYRDVDAGRLSLERAIPVVNDFHSILDGSPYSLSPDDDSDSTLYGRVGETIGVAELADLMITVSSNLATNIVIQLVDPARVTETMRAFGADSIQVLRGVEDIRAYEAGLSNTTTARDLGIIMEQIATGRAAGPTGTDSMLAILRRQEFNDGIPAGLPDHAVVAHKTGWITGIHHDMAFVTTPEGHRYVLVVMTRGIDDRESSARLMARIAESFHPRALAASP